MRDAVWKRRMWKSRNAPKKIEETTKKICISQLENYQSASGEANRNYLEILEVDSKKQIGRKEKTITTATKTKISRTRKA